MSLVTKTISNALGAETSRRRFAVQLGLGSAALLLAACGGGGGGGLVEDDNSTDDNTARLRRAFDELQPGMTSQDVINVVGRSADATTQGTLEWYANGGRLLVVLAGGYRNGLPLANTAAWSSSTETLSKDLRG